MFEASTLGSLIDAIRSVLRLGVDVLHNLFQAMLSLFKEVVQIASDLFTAPVHVPGLSQLYTALMDEQCTLSGVFSLVLAVPCTLVYKAITGKAPYISPSISAGEVKDVQDSSPIPQQAEIVIASMTIVQGLVDSALEYK